QGKYSRIITTLNKEMKESARNHEFEKAGVLRDQINAIKDVMERQFVAFTDELDQDIIAGSIDKKMAVMVVFSVREGKIMGKDDFLMAGVENSTPEEILSAFIKQYYANPRYIPGELIIPYPVPDQKVIKEWLSDLRGAALKVTTPQKGHKYRLLQMASKNASVIRNQEKQVKNALIDLKKYLKLPLMPHIIEGFDVSNISGKSAVGSMVQFHDTKPRKGKYRRYKLKTPGPDDYGMMQELITRRYQKIIDEGESPPDLILVDGGKGQLKVALDALKSLKLVHIPVIGLAKEFEHVFIPQTAEPLILPRNSEALFLLQRIRDEAHRFAVSYHRKLRSKGLEHSTLDDIKGVGSKRKMNLMRHFGDLEKIKKASIEEIMAVRGLNRQVAENIYNHFHPQK
ncbi:MAG: excinuclease ABC subunit UvrC, partial [Methanobacterium sp.]|nr:excinuclease ABC subunit UvrC [Methanobacterium sp.]